MGVCYQLLLEDEWDWSLSEKTKDECLKEFEEKYDGYIERIAEWPHMVVYDVDKSFPYTEERKELIRNYADNAYYRTDLGNGIIEIDLPAHTSETRAYIEDMQSRRTEEEKKASEEACKEKLKKMGY